MRGLTGSRGSEPEEDLTRFESKESPAENNRCSVCLMMEVDVVFVLPHGSDSVGDAATLKMRLLLGNGLVSRYEALWPREIMKGIYG